MADGAHAGSTAADGAARSQGRGAGERSRRSSATAPACARELRRGASRCARSSRPTATATAPCRARARRSPAARAGWRSPTRARPRELREAGLRDVRVLVMGALSPVELARGARGGRRCGRVERGALQARRGCGRRPRPRQARHRHGAARHPRPGGGLARGARGARDAEACELAGVMTHFATADDLDDDGFFASQLERLHALGARGQGRSTRRCSCTPPTAPRCCASRGALRHGALRDRDLRHGSVRRRSRAPGRSSRRSS